jgi:hypothetical protein
MNGNANQLSGDSNRVLWSIVVIHSGFLLKTIFIAINFLAKIKLLKMDKKSYNYICRFLFLGIDRDSGIDLDL